MENSTAITISFLETELALMEEMQHDLLERQQLILKYIQVLQNKLAALRKEKEPEHAAQ